MIRVVCGAPIAAVIFTIFFAIGAAIIQWIAKMFGGKGTHDQMVYALAAITTPFSMILGVVSLFINLFSLLAAFIAFCFIPLFLLAGIYVIVLEIMAVKGVNQVSWGAAAGSVLIPFAVILLLCCCVIGGTALAFGAAFRSALQQLQ